MIAYNYDALNLQKSLSLLNGSQSTYQYDEINRLLSIANQTSSLSTISSFNYTYDNVGNRKSMTTLQGMHSYTYDAIYQLMAADYPEGYDFPDTGYTYDSLGNRIHVDKQGTTINYATNSMNQYTSVGDAAYAYDENGNLISDGESTYEYDYENRLISASNLSHAGISYEYDPFGRRVEKNVDGAITKYIYDGDQVICETDGSGAITAKYVYGAGIDEVVTMERGGSTYFYHYDGLGNVSDITDETGSVAESYSYDAYGSSLDSSSVGNPYLFNGRRFDAETGLYNYRARYYDPDIGKFLQTDPLGYYDNINLYTYVYNNPLNFTDPFGLCSQGSYFGNAFEQLVLGNYTDNVNLLGTGMQVGAGVLGIDLLADIRDIAYDFTHWEWSWGHAGQTALDAIAILPVIGALKYSDEAAILAKRASKGTTKGITKSSRKRIKQLVNNLSKQGNPGLSQKKLDQLRRIANKADAKVRVDLKGVKGSGVRPHAHIEGMGKKVNHRHIWLQEGVK